METATCAERLFHSRGGGEYTNKVNNNNNHVLSWSFPTAAALPFLVAARPSGFRSIGSRTGRDGPRGVFGEADEEDARVCAVQHVFAVDGLDGRAGELCRLLRCVGRCLGSPSPWHRSASPVQQALRRRSKPRARLVPRPAQPQAATSSLGQSAVVSGCSRVGPAAAASLSTRVRTAASFSSFRPRSPYSELWSQSAALKTRLDSERRPPAP